MKKEGKFIIFLGVVVLLFLLLISFVSAGWVGGDDGDVGVVGASDDVVGDDVQEEQGFLSALKSFFSFKWLTDAPIRSMVPGGIGDSCSSHDDCDEGLYCNEGICDDTVVSPCSDSLPSQYILGISGNEKSSKELCDGCGNLDGTFHLSYQGTGEYYGDIYDYWSSQETFSVEGPGSDLQCGDISGLPGGYVNVDAVRFVLLIWRNSCSASLKLLGTELPPHHVNPTYTPFAVWDISDSCGDLFVNGKNDVCGPSSYVTYHCSYTSGGYPSCYDSMNPGIFTIVGRDGGDYYGCGCGNNILDSGEECDDGNRLNEDGCSNICEIESCESAADCDDELFCNGAETCELSTGNCIDGTPPDCDDDDPCTEDSCNEVTDICDNILIPGCECEPGDECRVSEGVCDPAEMCDADGTCPADAKSAAECRASAGACDLAETCAGGNDCPADAKSAAECRASAGDCDLAETCAGGNDCPADAKSVAECRASAGDCDLAESCNGVAVTCPADVFEPNGVLCDDGLFCTITDACAAGVCVGDENTCDDDDPCTIDSCNILTGCVNEENPFEPACVECESDDECSYLGDVGDDSECIEGFCNLDLTPSTCDTRPINEGGECGIPLIIRSYCNGNEIWDEQQLHSCQQGICDPDGTDDASRIECDYFCTDIPGDPPDAECAVLCLADTNCDDGVDCTADSCEVDFGSLSPFSMILSKVPFLSILAETPTSSCKYTPVDSNCDDDKDCTIDSCNPSTGCVHDSSGCGGDDDDDDDDDDCETDSDCNDDDSCTNDICSEGSCTNSPITCDDGEDCTDDVCNDEGVCENIWASCGTMGDCGEMVCEDGDCEYSLSSLKGVLDIVKIIKSVISVLFNVGIQSDDTGDSEGEWLREKSCQMILDTECTLGDPVIEIESCEGCTEDDECNDDGEGCPEDEEEFVCMDGNSFKKITTYECKDCSCEEVIDFTFDEECGEDTVDSYKCWGMLGWSECVTEFTQRGCVEGVCKSEKGENTSSKYCGGLFKCITDKTNPDQGHCKPDCNPSCLECEKCFTWNAESKCIVDSSKNGDSCYLSDSEEGVCEDGSCVSTTCDPIPGKCEKCDESLDPPLAVPDSDKNGISCDEGIPLGKEGFCKDGSCLEKNCENLNLGSDCGSGNTGTCCSDNQICCGAEGSNPMCCDSETEECRLVLNVAGYQQLKIAKSNGASDLELLMLIAELSLDPQYQEHVCSSKKDECEDDGEHKLCPGGYKDVCCPIEGSGSTCLKYDFVPPVFNLEDIDFTVGMCGDEECGIDQIYCDEENMLNGGVICCDAETELCSYSEQYGIPEQVLGSINAPHCVPKTYCEEGYSDCFYGYIFGENHICCKDGETTCFQQPPENIQCIDI